MAHFCLLKKKGYDTNGVLIPIDSFKPFDKFEVGYVRKRLKNKNVGVNISHEDKVYYYTSDIDLKAPRPTWTYLKRCINGFITYGDQFLKDFLDTTYDE